MKFITICAAVAIGLAVIANVAAARASSDARRQSNEQVPRKETIYLPPCSMQNAAVCYDSAWRLTE